MRSGPRHRSAAALALVALIGTSLPVLGQASQEPGAGPSGVTLTVEPFAAGLASPVFVTGDGSGSGTLFAVERPGRIRSISPDGTVEPTPFLDITERVLSGDERGLLGLAFHPDYPTNGRLFVDYTRRPDGATVISEFDAVGGAVDAGTERVLLVIPQPFANHNGGMVAFDAQGMLLIGMGDGGGGGDPLRNGQNRMALLGKLLRIDVDGEEPYGIPADNPFVNDPATSPEIFTFGIRNPWRFSVDRVTGDIFIGDVGQETWEEVDVVPAGTSGQDFGWNITEGTACYAASECDRAGLTEPVFTFPHNTGDCAITGGYVYRGERLPELQGLYVFGDYCSGIIRVLRAADAISDGTATAVEAGSLGRLGALVAFGQGDDGELYVVDITGRLLRLVAHEPA